MKHPIFHTSESTSKRMSKISLKGGKSESSLAKSLWKAGFRYRKNYKLLPGSPDIAILKYKIAIFVDGEFWHGYNWEVHKEKIQSNKEYWIEKIEENIARDKRNNKLLEELGWIPIHFWENDVKRDLKQCVQNIINIINDKNI